MQLSISMALPQLMVGGPAISYAKFDAASKGVGIDIDASGVILTRNAAASGWYSARTNIGQTTGKWYVENNWIDPSGNALRGGLATAASPIGPSYVGGELGSGAVASVGNIYVAAPFISGADASAIGGGDALIGFAIDMDSKKIWMSFNGVWKGGGSPESNTLPNFTWTGDPELFVATSLYLAGTGTQTWNFGESAFTYAAPAGYNEGWYA